MCYNHHVKAYRKHQAAIWELRHDEWNALITQWAMEGDFLLQVV